jgi:flagellar basal-body rod protein FlgB
MAWPLLAHVTERNSGLFFDRSAKVYMKIFGPTLSGMEKALDLRFERHALLASNAANSETPGYKARELDFAGQLQKAFGDTTLTSPVIKTDSRHMDLSLTEKEHIVFDNTSEAGADGNNVDLDINMGKISANARSYESAAGLISQQFKFIKQFIRRGA